MIEKDSVSNTMTLDRSAGGKTSGAARWLTKIRAVADRRKAAEADWIENVEMLNNNFSDVATLDDRVNVNMFYSIVRAMIPALYFRDPELTVEPKRPQDEPYAPVMQAVLNYWFRRLGMKKTIQRMIADALCYPFAICKVGYVLEEVELEVTTDETAEIVGMDEERTQQALSDHSIEKRIEIRGSHPIAHRVAFRSFFMDPKAACIEEAEWVAEEIIRHLDDVKKDPAYKGTRNLGASARAVKDGGASKNREFYGMEDRPKQAGSGLGPFSEPGTLGDDPDDQDLVRLYEIWDRREGRVYVVAEGHANYLRDDEWPYEIDRFPYVTQSLTIEVPDEPCPVPLLSVLKPQQREINDIRSYQLDHIKRAVGSVGVDTAKMDKKSLAQVRRGGRLKTIETKGNPNEVIANIPGAPLNPEVHIAMQDVKNDLAEMSGVAEFQRGLASPKGSTATEQRLMAQSASLSVDRMMDLTMSAVADIAKLVADLLQQFGTKEDFIRIWGDTGWEWREYTKDDIQGDYDVQIYAGSQLNLDQSVQIKQALDMFNLFAPIGLQGGPIRFAPLARRVMEAMRIRKPDEILIDDGRDVPPQDPYDEEALLEMGGAPKISPNDEDDQHIPVHYEGIQKAKTPQEMHRRLTHLREHEVQKITKQQAAMMQAFQGGGMPGAAPGGPMGQSPMGQVNGGGMGRQQPAPGQPANPRAFAQKPPRTEDVNRSVSKREVS